MIYAKVFKRNNSYIGETLEEHTNTLIDNYSVLREAYGKEFEEKLGVSPVFWKLLEIACIFHDLGKASSAFQHKIQKLLGEDIKVPYELRKEIPHNFLSVAFLPEPHLLDLDDNNFLMLFYAIAYHHNRLIDFDKSYYEKIVIEDLLKKTGELRWVEEKLKDLGVSLTLNPSSKYFFMLDLYSNTFESIKRDKYFILLKGMLHRLDHSSSAHITVESERVEDPENKLVYYIETEKKSTLKDFQLKARDYRDESILFVGSTGMGKTEFAMNWIGEQKAFYTLPVRVSVNAMYERVAEIVGQGKAGLLHSESLFYNLDSQGKKEDEYSLEEPIYRTNLSRQLSMPITVTTADQIFTAVFKWRGYEKIYATLMYSKVVVDEPQSYSPEILAMIVKALQEISNYGGKFCLMSATVHPFVKNQLENYAKVLEPVFNREKKHKVEIKDSEIDELLNEIEVSYKKGEKVLVIANTVKKAQDLYNQLKYLGNVKLLHSLFVQKDRKIKESEIQNDYKGNGAVVWITTQIVEASLDIDYDILFTEIATLDSLIQRMGRIYRRNGRIINEAEPPNIVIATNKPSDKYKIYDKEIVDFTERILKNYNGKILTDELKNEMIDEVYDLNKIKSTEYFKKFKYAYDLLDNGFEVDERGEAQRLFRDIANITVIPESVYYANKEMIDTAIDKISDKKIQLVERLKELKIINDFIVSIPAYRFNRDDIYPISEKHRIYVFKTKYDYDLGVTFEKAELDDFSNII